MTKQLPMERHPGLGITSLPASHLSNHENRLLREVKVRSEACRDPERRKLNVNQNAANGRCWSEDEANGGWTINKSPNLARLHQVSSFKPWLLIPNYQAHHEDHLSTSQKISPGATSDQLWIALACSCLLDAGWKFPLHRHFKQLIEGSLWFNHDVLSSQTVILLVRPFRDFII